MFEGEALGLEAMYGAHSPSKLLLAVHISCQTHAVGALWPACPMWAHQDPGVLALLCPLHARTSGAQ